MFRADARKPSRGSNKTLGCRNVTIDMGNLALWISACVNTGIAVSLMFHYRTYVRRGLLSDAGAKRAYSWASFVIGFVVALVAFYTLMLIARAPSGHGEILIAAPILNAALSLALLLIGRTVICWKPLRW